jgi:hypothetical protein
MARTETGSSAAIPVKRAVGAVLDDAASPAAAAIKLGFKPRYIKLYSALNVLEWFEGMTSAHHFLTTGSTGVRTLVTSGGPTLGTDGQTLSFAVTQNVQYRYVAEE